MSRNFVMSLSFLCLLALSAMITNCGSSSKTSLGSGGPYNVVGDWQLTISSSTSTGYGVINSAGLALFFDSLGETLEFPTITGASSFSGTATIYEPGGVSSSATAQGNVNSAASISGSFSGNGASGTFSANSYSAVASVTALTGAMTGESPSGELLDLTFSPSGSNESMSFSGGFGSCFVSGTFTQETTLNVFDVTMTFSGTDCATPTTTAITGLGLESSADYLNFNSGSAGTYLYADMLDPAGPFILEIYPAIAGGAAASRHASRPEHRGSPWSGNF